MTSSASDAAKHLFGSPGSFLRATLCDDTPPAAGDWIALPGGAQARNVDKGVLEVAAPRSQGRTLLSAGVHGNETAPVEMLDAIATRLVEGALIPRQNLMLILANPPALKSGQRFETENMNRLFLPADLETSAGESQVLDSEEKRRARRLMLQAGRFLANNTESAAWHLDLHTAIRDSRFRRFAICPDTQSSAARSDAFARLGQWDIQAVVISGLTRSTFSAWSARTFNARSFTLELGRARPFGKNDLNDFRLFRQGVDDFLRGTDFSRVASRSPILFEVTREIYRESENLCLHLPPDAANFTPLTEGDIIATDGERQFRARRGEHLLFPNASVEIGQRALLFIKASSPEA